MNYIRSSRGIDMVEMGVLIVDADAQRRQQLGTVLSFMGIPWQEVAHVQDL